MKKNIYDKNFPPPVTIIIYDLLIKMNVYAARYRTDKHYGVAPWLIVRTRQFALSCDMALTLYLRIRVVSVLTTLIRIPYNPSSQRRN